MTITVAIVPLYLMFFYQNCAQNQFAFEKGSEVQFDPVTRELIARDNSQFVSVGSITLPAKIAPVVQTTIDLQFKNIGDTTWSRSNNYKLHLEEFKDWSAPEFIDLPKETVAPGEVVNFKFQVKSPANSSSTCLKKTFPAVMTVTMGPNRELPCPGVVEPGKTFTTKIKIGNSAKDWVAITEPNAPFNTSKNLKYLPLPRPVEVTLTAPTTKGVYQLRFLPNDGFDVTSSCNFTVDVPSTAKLASSTNPRDSATPTPTPTPSFFGDFGDKAAAASVEVCANVPAPTATPTPTAPPRDDDPPRGEEGCQDQSGACSRAGYFEGFVGGTCPEFGKNEPCPKNRGATDTDGVGECGCHEECDGPPSQGGTCRGP